MTTASADSIAMRDFSESLPMALLQAREAAMRLFRPVLSAHDLTEQQWRVLRALAAADQLEVGAIAESTFLLAPSVSRILKDLETRQLIVRSAVASDQRRAEISLSPTGYDLVATVAPKSEAVYNQIEAGFGAGELADLIDRLATLRDKTNSIEPGVATPEEVTLRGA